MTPARLFIPTRRRIHDTASSGRTFHEIYPKFVTFVQKRNLTSHRSEQGRRTSAPDTFRSFSQNPIESRLAGIGSRCTFSRRVPLSREDGATSVLDAGEFSIRRDLLTTQFERQIRLEPA